MMTRKKMMSAVCSAAGLLILILDTQTALRGAGAGMELCIKTVIPSLFPFLFFCSLLSGTLWGTSSRLIRFLGKKTGIPIGAESILIAAFLGGYPAGAQALGAAYREKRLNRSEAAHLLTFCSNAGPAFIFGMMASQFDDSSAAWALLLIHIISALFTGTFHRGICTAPHVLSQDSKSITQVMDTSLRSMAFICGWIILFRIILEFASVWFFWCLPDMVQVILTGLLELSNGCCQLSRISDPHLRFVTASMFLSAGGLCITMQTASVIGDLPMHAYVKGKVLQTVFSLFFCVLYLYAGWYAIILSIVLFLIKPKNAVDFQKSPLYNGEKIDERNPYHAVS